MIHFTRRRRIQTQVTETQRIGPEDETSANTAHLPLTLIINLAGRLRRMIPLREEHQKQQSQDIRDHQEQIRIDRRKSHSQAELVAARPRDAEEDADEEGRNDVPVAEDHRGDGEIAVAKINTR